MDQPIDQLNQQPETFENLLTQYEHQTPEPGQFIDATIIAIDKEGVLVDIGIKRDVLIPVRDISNLRDAQRASLVPGEKVPVYVIGPGEGGELQLSLGKGLEQQSWDRAEKAMQSGETLSLEILGHNKGGMIVRFEDLRGFLPYSLLPDLQGVRSPKRAEAIKNSLVGKPLEVKITEVDRTRNRLIFSAEAAYKERMLKRMDEFKKGQVYTGKVVKLVDFGAFVDLNGIDGLVHISQLDWKKVKHPSEIVKVGDEIEVKVIDVDVEHQRISLSRKATLPGPWQTIANELKAGDYVEGVVTRLAEFGAFIKLPQGVEGLVHASQIGYSSTQNPQQAVKPGDRVLLRVLEVKPEKKRIALSMRQVPIERQIAWSMDNMDIETESEKPVSSAEQEPEEAPDTEAPDIEAPEVEAPEVEAPAEDLAAVDQAAE
jgi:small subunit ribosomal protein S1